MPAESSETPQQRRAQFRLRNRKLGRVLLAIGLIVLSLPLVTNLVRGTDAERPEDPPSEMLRRAGLAEGRGDFELAAQLYERVLELEMGESPRDTLKALVRASRAGLSRIAESR
ncbi:MAG: hypothetical protein OXE73_16720 [Gammaproteobacteria bacterium]|nr:hypothetical protein [Gammaproteobacteria bacterium]